MQLVYNVFTMIICCVLSNKSYKSTRVECLNNWHWNNFNPKIHLDKIVCFLKYDLYMILKQL